MARLMLTEEPDRSMPLVPNVSEPAPVTPTLPVAPVTRIPLQFALDPMVRDGPAEVPVQRATSPVPGAEPPQLAESLRSVPVADLVTSAADTDKTVHPIEAMNDVNLKDSFICCGFGVSG